MYLNEHLKFIENLGIQTGTFGFARNMCQLFAKSKEPVFLPVLALTNNETNEKYIEKRDNLKFWTILAI